jgi:FtsZ-interacting cell division protein YlmF
VTGLSEDDSEAYRDSLARSSENSLVQLHSERIQVESRPVAEFTVPETLRQRQSTNRVHAAPSVPLQQNTTSRYSVGATRFTAASSESRTTRQVEHLRPLSYGDAEGISIGLRNGSAVVLDLTSVRPELAKRILDFSFGVTSAFEGQVDRYADRVYILTRNGTLTESERLQIKL